MGLSRKLSCAFIVLTLIVVCLSQGLNVNGRSKLLSRRNNDFNKPLMTLNNRQSPRSIRLNRFKTRQNARFESFNRPEGTESFIVTSDGSNDPQSSNQDQYGRTFGQYGSYKKHTSWQNAVAADIQRQALTPQNFKISFPWLSNHLQRPGLNGFSLNGFWNSYAVPEGGPNVQGLGTKKAAESEKVADTPSASRTPQ